MHASVNIQFHIYVLAQKRQKVYYAYSMRVKNKIKLLQVTISHDLFRYKRK